MKNSMTTNTDVVYSDWIYKGKMFDESLLKGFAGFVYLITDTTTGRKYIGRKYGTFSRKKKGKRIKFESDWKEYYGSSEELHRLIEEKGKDKFTREIICLGKTRGEVNFAEILAQVLVGVLESDDWINSSINKWRKANVSKYKCLSEIREFFKT